MPQRLKDDERRLLGIAADGDPMLIDVECRRTRYLLRRWAILGWYDSENSQLTKQGRAMAAKHGIPVDATVADEIDTELEDTSLPFWERH